MERSLLRYILRYTWRDQILLLLLTTVSFPLIYINLEIPKRIVNNALAGKNIPEQLLGFQVDQVSYLMGLSLLLLFLITVNGGLKYWLNVFSGVVGERTLRRLRHDLYELVLRFPLPHFKSTSAGEIIPMIVAETEPIGGFIGESVSLPVFQGGLLVTYLVFIFNQDLWLGLAAIALYPPQVWLIPRLQRRINLLAKDRVQTARQLSDRIGESVAGAAEIRGNDTFHLERADISSRLGRIYAIRFDIYKRKFFVKFLNNFLAQITPFFFYSAGGYLVIKGSLSLGALVAVLAAYKDILSPWKELLTWYSTKEDVRIKYEQIVSQFEPEGLVDGALLLHPPEVVAPLGGPIVAASLAYTEDGAGNRVDRVSFEIAGGERVALVGSGHSGKDDVTQLLARLTFPTGGRVAIGTVNLADVHQAVPGRRIAYCAQNAHIFSGTVAHNLFYGLKHRPLQPAARDAAGAEAEARRIRDAELAGNSTDDPAADWIDYAAAGVADEAGLIEQALATLRLVELEAEVINVALASCIEPTRDPPLAAMALEARARIRDRVRGSELAMHVQHFDRASYHPGLSVAENVLFGAPRSPAFAAGKLADNAEFVDLLRSVGVLEDFLRAGAMVAAVMVELFEDVAPDSPLFDQFSFISHEDLPEFRTLLAKMPEGKLAGVPARSRTRLLALTLQLIAERHRIGVVDEPMEQKVLAARAEFARRYAARGDVVEFFDDERFSASLSIQENVLFGRVAFAAEHAQARIGALIREVAAAAGMDTHLFRLGLEYQVGTAGSRLTYSQRQRVAIARALLKNPDVLVFNEPTSGLDPATETRVVCAVLQWAGPRTVVWALGRADLAREFGRVLVLDQGRLVEEGAFEALAAPGTALTRLLH